MLINHLHPKVKRKEDDVERKLWKRDEEKKTEENRFLGGMADAHLPVLGGAAQVAKARKRGPPSQPRKDEDTAAQAAGGPRTKKPKAAAALDECAVVSSSVEKILPRRVHILRKWNKRD